MAWMATAPLVLRETPDGRAAAGSAGQVQDGIGVLAGLAEHADRL